MSRVCMVCWVCMVCIVCRLCVVCRVYKVCRVCRVCMVCRVCRVIMVCRVCMQASTAKYYFFVVSNIRYEPKYFDLLSMSVYAILKVQIRTSDI